MSEEKLAEEQTVKLTQEEIDVLNLHLEHQEISDTVLFKVLEKLPDSEYGEGRINPNFGCYCVLCEEKIERRDEVGERYGKFVHISCAKEQDSDVEVKEGEL